MAFPKTVKLVEVGARDGLQNEKKHVPTPIKIEFINRLSQTGLKVIEATSFVSPKWIPQLADHKEVYEKIKKHHDIIYPVLIFNQKGLDLALSCDVKAISVFATPSETFSLRNANCAVSENLARMESIIRIAKEHHVAVRGYISCVLGCPFEGAIESHRVTSLAEKLISLGCDEISLGDTIGIGTPIKTSQLLESVLQKIPLGALAVHFHDTYGQALANIYVALEHGIHIIDSSVSGLGGCPYAQGATGNVATEDVLYMLNGMGIETHVDLNQLVDIGNFMMHYLGHKTHSKVSLAMLSKCSNDS